MTQLISKAICVVEFGNIENQVYMYVPRVWIMTCSGKSVIVVLPENQDLSVSDPDYLTRIPSCNWQSYEGTIVYETDSVEEAIQMVNFKNNYVKDAKTVTYGCNALLVSIIKDLNAELSLGNYQRPSTSFGVTKRPNIVTMLEAIRPIILEIDQCIDKIVAVNRNSPTMNEKLEIMDQDDAEEVLRFSTFSKNFADSLGKSIDHHLNCLVTKMKMPSVTTNELMLENVNMIHELMSGFLVTVLTMTGKIK